MLPIVEQGLSRDGFRFNFSHGETYISPSSLMAQQYALHAGCEILDYIKRLSMHLHNEGHTADVNRIVPMDLQQTLMKTYCPVLVRISGLRFRDIDTENGDDKWAVLRRYEEFLRTSHGEMDITSWKLTTPIPHSQLEISQF